MQMTNLAWNFREYDSDLRNNGEPIFAQRILDELLRIVKLSAELYVIPALLIRMSVRERNNRWSKTNV